MVKLQAKTAFVLGLTVGAMLTIGVTSAWKLWDWIDGVEVVDRFEVIERAYIQCGMDRTSELVRKKPFIFGSTVWKGDVCGDGELIIQCQNEAELNAGYVTTGPGTKFAVDPRCENVIWL